MANQEIKKIGDSLDHDDARVIAPEPVMSEREKDALQKLRDAADSAGGIKQK